MSFKIGGLEGQQGGGTQQLRILASNRPVRCVGVCVRASVCGFEVGMGTLFFLLGFEGDQKERSHFCLVPYFDTHAHLICCTLLARQDMTLCVRPGISQRPSIWYPTLSCNSASVVRVMNEM